METPTSSRGNVAIAALLLVTAIGAAALVLDSARVHNSQSQLAAGGIGSDPVASTNATKDATKIEGEIDKTCQVGYDYVVRYEGKDLSVKPTLNEKSSKNKAYPVDEKKGNQCRNPDGTARLKSVDGRTCSRDLWHCHVTVCTPPEMTKDGKEDCIMMPPDFYKAGVLLDKTNLKDDLAQAVLQNVRDADTKDAANILTNTQKIDPEVSRAIYDSLGGSERQAEVQKEADQANQELQKLRDLSRDACQGNSYGLGTLFSPGACAEASKNLTAAEQKYADLQREAQILKGSQVELTPGANPDPSKCVNDVTCGAINPDLKDKRFEVPPAKSKEECAKNPYQPGCNGSTFTPSPPPGPTGCTGGNCGSGQGSGLGNFNPAQFLPLLSSLLNNLLQPTPSCTITASPKNITQAGQPVTLSWTSQNAQSAYLSASGQVGPTGSMTVNPQQTTTYTMQVVGYPPQNTQQQQPYNPYNPYGQQQQQDPYCYTSYNPIIFYQQPATPGCLNYRAPSGYGGGYGGAPGIGGGTPQQAQCTTQVTVGAQTGTGTTGDKPKAQISCQPKIADVGMQVAISYACQNSAASKGDGFSTNNQMSGSATVQVASPTIGETTATYGLTCSNQGQTDSAQCTVQVNKPSIVLVANPKAVKSGEVSNIGWVTGAMDKCTISSPTLNSFTNENANNTSVSGVAKTPPLTQNAKFVLTCTTKAGGTKTAEVNVLVQ